ncbi:DUF998 domain-containing protein [Amycolatopsis suaedae]|uniref:DUF998 domain-containing protein n=1 Tax=Amycolatopsis suaedae TaxID=2510978 RepID=A0A4Q7J7A3_9PSEU|nr:DUF998 domain-containing protein [Amycolatopsis suaedae]RZQ63039.1 DUF998 domain-containing protein [Amycolatopsis suaedae]
MQPVTSDQHNLVRSYLFLRRAIGVIGLALPAVLIVGKLLLQGGPLLNSISGYHHSVMGGVFVGSMCAVGTFLFSYRGYDRTDDICGNVAAVAAIGLALFPTTPSGSTDGTERLIGLVHLAFAAVFFVMLAVFCLFLFTKSDGTAPSPQKLRRNRVYRACGVAMMVCLLLIVFQNVLFDDVLDAMKPVLWLESAAILAFGVAWWVKGAVLLRDR